MQLKLETGNFMLGNWNYQRSTVRYRNKNRAKGSSEDKAERPEKETHVFFG